MPATLLIRTRPVCVGSSDREVFLAHRPLTAEEMETEALYFASSGGRRLEEVERWVAEMHAASYLAGDRPLELVDGAVGMADGSLSTDEIERYSIEGDHDYARERLERGEAVQLRDLLNVRRLLSLEVDYCHDYIDDCLPRGAKSRIRAALRAEPVPPAVSIVVGRGDCSDTVREAVRSALPEVDPGRIQVIDTCKERSLVCDGLTGEQMRRAREALDKA